MCLTRGDIYFRFAQCHLSIHSKLICSCPALESTLLSRLRPILLHPRPLRAARRRRRASARRREARLYFLCMSFTPVAPAAADHSSGNARVVRAAEGGSKGWAVYAKHRQVCVEQGSQEKHVRGKEDHDQHEVGGSDQGQKNDSVVNKYMHLLRLAVRWVVPMKCRLSSAGCPL